MATSDHKTTSGRAVLADSILVPNMPVQFYPFLRYPGGRLPQARGVAEAPAHGSLNLALTTIGFELAVAVPFQNYAARVVYASICEQE